MKIETQISALVKEAVKALYGAEITESQANPSPTKKEFEGDYTVVVFPFLKASHKKPEETAQEIGEWLKSNSELISDFNVIKGFLNLSVNASHWTKDLLQIASDDNYGIKPVTDESPLVMVEYSSPNTNKPLHLGHVRNNLLGYSLA
jgi:arginyl-tRNA synthetase